MFDNIGGTQNIEDASAIINQFNKGVTKGNWSEKERVALLSMSATLNSSLQYWSKVIDSTDSVELRCWSWKRTGCVAAFDAGGFFIGGWFGAPVMSALTFISSDTCSC